MSDTDSDPFRYDDGAYVLGALEPAEHAAFERHLAECAACRARVAGARATVGLLAALPNGALLDELVPADEPVPATVLAGLLRRAARDRRRRRVVVGGLGTAAAAAIVALVIAVWPSPSEQPAQPAQQAQRFTAVRAAPVSASGVLVDKQWGTQINVRCRYTRELAGNTAYRLVVVDHDRRHFDAGGWTLGDQPTEFTGGTQVRRADIASVQITLADGQPVLELTP